MSTTIQIKRSSTASAVPLSGDLAVGELAVNLADKRLFAKQADGTIIELSTNPTDLDAATLRIDGVEITASATELNSLDGLTATTAELNILDGVTATATEINKLDGFTGSTAELNFVDGVTSNIQTQLDGKATTAQGALADSAVQPDDNVSFGTGSFSGAVDVTGTVTADGLTVDGASQLNTTGLASGLTITGNDNNNVKIRFDNIGTGGGDFVIQSGIQGASNEGLSIRDLDNSAQRLYISSGGDVSFYEDTGTTAKMVWDASAESLQLFNTAGTSFNNGGLQIGSGAAVGDYTMTAGFNTAGEYGYLQSTKIGSYFSDIALNPNGGNVGIGTASPAEKLNINTGSNNGGLRLDSSSGNYPFITFTENGAASCYLGDAGGFGGTSTNAGIRAPLGAIEFRTGSSERARIDSSGNLLVGTTDVDLGYTDGDTGIVSNPNGLLQIARDSSLGYPLLYLNRLNHDGKHIEFWKDGNSVGSIGSYNGRLCIGEGDVGLRFADDFDQIAPFNPSTGAIRDNAINLGAGVNRFKDLYLSGQAYANYLGSASDTNTNIAFDNADVIRFTTGAAERARIDNAGNLLVGKTSPNITTLGIELHSSNYIAATADGQAAAYFTRKSSDGDIALFRKDGSTVGSIGTYSGGMSLINGDTGIGLYGAYDIIGPLDASGATRDAAISIGYTGQRFKDLYLSGGVYLGGTGAANKLDDYETGDWTPSADSNITIPTVHNATYTRVGDTVTINAWFTAYASAASFIIGGLPYVVSGRTTASLSNIGAEEVISNQVLSTSIYGYGATTSGVVKDFYINFSYKI